MTPIGALIAAIKKGLSGLSAAARYGVCAFFIAVFLVASVVVVIDFNSPPNSGILFFVWIVSMGPGILMAFVAGSMWISPPPTSRTGARSSEGRKNRRR